MPYIVQEGMYNQESFVRLVGVLERAGLSYSIHKIIPFSNIIIPEPSALLQNRIFAFGAGTMSEIAKFRGWQPHEAFTLDVALVDSGDSLVYKVVEINSINGSAFYAADLSKLIQDLDYFLNKYYGKSRENKQLVQQFFSF